jgi:Acyclic terpene utilisation family protein AtuA
LVEYHCGVERLAIGCGSAYAEDRIEPALALAASGHVNYMAFDCLAERTLALAQARRLQEAEGGHDRRTRRLVLALADFLARGNRVVGSFGAANPGAAGRAVVEALRAADLPGLRVAVVHGDDVRDEVLEHDPELPEMGMRAGAVRGQIVSANAYIGAEPIVEALAADAQFVLGGRFADPSLFVGPICHELGWALDDWERLGAATLIGHLLECGVHSTGGNFEDPPYRVVPDPHNLGFPYAEVTNQDVVITKLDGTGGAVDARTTKTQLMYEIHDPSAYPTPDVTADFSEVTVTELGKDRVRVGGARGRPRPPALKVLVGLNLGWKAVGEISYAGPGCVERARRSEEIVRRRLEPLAGDIDELRCDLVGVSSLTGGVIEAGYPSEVRLRIAARCGSREAADAVAYEGEYLYFGPAGAGGATGSVVPAIGVTPAYLPRAAVRTEVEVIAS